MRAVEADGQDGSPAFTSARDVELKGIEGAQRLHGVDWRAW
jgi:hypothetical protein